MEIARDREIAGELEEIQSDANARLHGEARSNAVEYATFDSLFLLLDRGLEVESVRFLFMVGCWSVCLEVSLSLSLSLSGATATARRGAAPISHGAAAGRRCSGMGHGGEAKKWGKGARPWV